jgi:hypothetical protein
MTTEEALQWLWERTKEHVEPFDGVSEMCGNTVIRRIWHCWGCNGEFISKDFVPYVGYGEDPTDETFGHEPNCKYLAVKDALAKVKEAK